MDNDIVPVDDLCLDEDEFLISSLEDLGTSGAVVGKNQVYAVTNKRLLIARLESSGSSAWTRTRGPEQFFSIDLRYVAKVRHKTIFALGGVLLGALIMCFGLLMGFAVLDGELDTHDYLRYSIMSLGSLGLGFVLIVGLKRRVLIFESPEGSCRWKWVSAPLNYKSSQAAAWEICEFLCGRSAEEYYGSEEGMPQEYLTIARDDYIVSLHWIFLILLPFIAVFWGIINLLRKKTRSGMFLFKWSIIWMIGIVIIVWILIKVL